MNDLGVEVYSVASITFCGHRDQFNLKGKAIDPHHLLRKGRGRK
jgi:hypothetical protein